MKYAMQTCCCTESEWRFTQLGNTLLHITIGIIFPFHLEFLFAAEPLKNKLYTISGFLEVESICHKAEKSVTLGYLLHSWQQCQCCKTKFPEIIKRRFQLSENWLSYLQTMNSWGVDPQKSSGNFVDAELKHDSTRQYLILRRPAIWNCPKLLT